MSKKITRKQWLAIESDRRKAEELVHSFKFKNQLDQALFCQTQISKFKSMPSPGWDDGKW